MAGCTKIELFELKDESMRNALITALLCLVLASPLQAESYPYGPSHWVGTWRSWAPSRPAGGLPRTGTTRYISLEGADIRLIPPTTAAKIRADWVDYSVTLRFRVIDSTGTGPLQTMTRRGHMESRYGILGVSYYFEPTIRAARCGFRLTASPAPPKGATYRLEAFPRGLTICNGVFDFLTTSTGTLVPG